jgi:hypothetical protein
MSTVSKHETPKRSRADAWFVLAVTGGSSAILQMWHATHSGGAVLLIAVIVGLAPAAAAIGLSHVVASHKSAMLLRVITILVMLAVMAASASAIAAVVRPIDGPVFAWVFAVALDASALACVWVLLGENDRKAAEGTALLAAEQTATEARQEAACLRGDLAAVRAELETARQERSSALEKLAVLAGRQPRAPRKAGTARRSARRSASPDPADDDLSVEAQALKLLATDLDMSGGELARRLGVSPGYGRKLKARLQEEDRPLESAPGAPGERAEERS